MKVTPDDGYYVHTFYDECPWSPDGRQLAVTRLPYQQRKPQWGDVADVCIIDLEEQSIRTVYRTRAWSFQVGANAQWSDVSNRYVYTNDIIDGQVVCVRIDLESGAVQAYSGAKYDVAPDGSAVISPYLLNMNIHQYGYAVPDPPGGTPVPFTDADMKTEGLWKTELATDSRQLLMPMEAFIDAASDSAFYKGRTGYLFHSKFNKQGTRIMQVFRSLVGTKGRDASLFTLDANGKNLQQCLSREHWNQKARLGGSGNHPNWHPDGEHIIMNCVPRWLGYQDMLFCSFRYDGSDFRVLSEKHLGSGHPSIEPEGRYLVADAYVKQTWVVKNGEIPIRLIDLREQKEHTLCTISNNVGNKGKMYSDEGGSQFKLDPHPAWARDYRKLCVNGAPGGERQVYTIDLHSILGS
jgi:Tol biopolymer transport system component